jgi:hypothetical protein
VVALSLIEIVFVLGVAAKVGQVAIPETLSALDDRRAAGAARYVSTRLSKSALQNGKSTLITPERLTTRAEKARAASHM